MSKLMELVEEYGALMVGYAFGGKLSDGDPVLAKIRDAVQELAMDAARYRWLRDGNSIKIFGVHERWTTSHRLDIVVDTLMTKTNEGDAK